MVKFSEMAIAINGKGSAIGLPWHIWFKLVEDFF